MGAKVPMVLIDNGSTLNVCPFRTNLKIGLDVEKIVPSPLTVRAYDNTSRKVIRTFKAPCNNGLLEIIVEFHMMDITPKYNLLLGSMASSCWSYSFYFASKDEDPMEKRNFYNTWR